jgi:hypothetical protein
LFYSEGPKGTLTKVVGYTPLENLPSCFNLGFGTLKVNKSGKEYDGSEISDNGDRNKILATVALTAYTFVDLYPEKKIYLKGSNKVRTRLYQIAINHAFDELSKKFVIFGDTAEGNNYNLEPFTTGVNYTGFLVEKR